MTSETPEKKKAETSKRPLNETEKPDQENDRAKDLQSDTADSGKSLQERLEQAEKDAKEHYDRLLRISAEFENYKKRMVREKEDYRKFANETLLQALLPVVDNLERAIQAVDEKDRSENPLVKGVEMTLSEILKVFEKFAVKPIPALKEPFDPMYHQAVMQEETDQHPDNTVVKELQKGYLLHDRLLRPSMVVVSKEPNRLSEKTEKESAEDTRE
ncbi:MAG: nucleotide exchange factor GrpE [Deltaproteobacteria bacterium]|nr:nucleotide exchange factor GrpE [Deltaproteobacteria bacterium]MBW1956705.1 nucleotide exchange factor GrpE [Deltaproteobacteria bacterium]MBW2042556.1 nucleotide exchange factor GrpE [Deltaproteobacteria bacterium]MBW2130910.1 nucleotide exchange factor GrpE [Deltaproteobacteria bacterium]